MPKYLLRVVGEVEVTAPNAVQALNLVKGGHYLGDKWIPNVKLSAGTADVIPQSPRKVARADTMEARFRAVVSTDTPLQFKVIGKSDADKTSNPGESASGDRAVSGPRWFPV